MTVYLGISDEHPLVLEISSLKAAVSRFQDEAHGASVKLQRFSLDTLNAHDRVLFLEKENALLKSELGTLRANPTDSLQVHPAIQQSQQLSLSLRSLNEKLTLTEEALAERTAELAHVQSELARGKMAEESAYALAASARGREEEGKIKERDLELKVKEIYESVKLSDFALSQYADLVRSLEGRTSNPKSPGHSRSSSGSITVPESNNSSVTLVDSISEGKHDLHKLFDEFSAEREKLHEENSRLKYSLDVSHTQYTAESQKARQDRVKLAEVEAELEKLRIDDHTAANIVSRYMKFSQSSTDALQVSLMTMKARHAATVDTLTTEISALSSQLNASQTTVNKLRDALDELGKEIIKEGFGRRREVALRVRMLSREDGIMEGLKRICIRAHESLERHHDRAALEKITTDLDNLLTVMDGREVAEGPHPRLLAAQIAVNDAVEELHAKSEQIAELQSLLLLGKKPSILGKRHPPHEASPQTNEILHIEAPSEVGPVTPQTEPLLVESSQALETERPMDLLPEATSTPPPPPPEITSINLVDTGSVMQTSVIPVSPPSPPPRHPLLDDLEHVSRRYDDLWRSFRDCHLALQDLKNQLSNEVPRENHSYLAAAVERLNDYNEDARVELEIRIADEALLARGFESLLALPSEVQGEDVEAQIRAFTSGDDLNVKRTQQNFGRKLDDVENDISVLKGVLYDPEQPTSPVMPISSREDTDSSGWTSWIRPSPIRPVSPVTPPTFGDVMTSPRLRLSPSMKLNSAGAVSKHDLNMKDPLTGLGLRIAKPSRSSYIPSVEIPAMRGSRQRTTSTMYMLGIGSASSSNGFQQPPSVTIESMEIGEDVE